MRVQVPPSTTYNERTLNEIVALVPGAAERDAYENEGMEKACRPSEVNDLVALPTTGNSTGFPVLVALAD